MIRPGQNGFVMARIACSSVFILVGVLVDFFHCWLFMGFFCL